MTLQLKLERIKVEQAESELMRTGEDLALMVIAMPKDRKTRAQAKLYLKLRHRAERARLELTIEEVAESAKAIDSMIPGEPA